MRQCPPSRRAEFDLGAGHDPGAALRRAHRVEHNQPGIVDAAIGIFESTRILRLERPAGRIVMQVERRRRRQFVTAADVVVEEQAEPQ